MSALTPFAFDGAAVRVVADPQIRITPRGIEALQKLMTAEVPLALDVEGVTP